MGKTRLDSSSSANNNNNRSKTLPSSPTHSFSSSSSSDFEFRISLSPRKSSAELCPADELFYKGKILPLQTSSRISMVRTLLLASSSTSSSSDTTTTASRDSSSSNDSTSSFAADLSLLANGDPCSDSTRPSSATDDIDNIDINIDIKNTTATTNNNTGFKRHGSSNKNSTSSKYFSLSRFSSVFRKDIVNPLPPPPPATENNVKKVNASAKEVIRKYLKKVKPLYEKLSSKHPGRSPCVGGGSPVLETTSSGPLRTTSNDVLLNGIERSTTTKTTTTTMEGGSSFSGNLKKGSISTAIISGSNNSNKVIKRGYVASCPSSMRSSPSHSGVLSRTGMPMAIRSGTCSSSSSSYSSDASTMEELQNAIQGAIAHCKNSMVQSTSSSFNNQHQQRSNSLKCKAFEI